MWPIPGVYAGRELTKAKDEDIPERILGVTGACARKREEAQQMVSPTLRRQFILCKGLA